MTERRLVSLCCLAAILAVAVVQVNLYAEAGLAAGNAGAAGNSAAAMPPAQLVREVVYNELHDHDTHGYWRYWIRRTASNETLTKEQVETAEGPVELLQMTNGRPLSGDRREEEESRMRRLLTSASEQARHRKDYAEDEHRIARILVLLPDAFLYETAPNQFLPEGECHHLKFRPNPDYPAHSIEARIFHAMAGDLWISVRNKRLVRLDGQLQQNVDFGYGILGRLYKDGWFRLERTNVGVGTAAGNGGRDWKTRGLEIHMNGRAMLFKTIARETSEVRGGFVPVPAGLSLEQAAALIGQPVVASNVRPVGLTTVKR